MPLARPSYGIDKHRMRNADHPAIPQQACRESSNGCVRLAAMCDPIPGSNFFRRPATSSHGLRSGRLLLALCAAFAVGVLSGCSSGSTDVLSEVGAVGLGGAVGAATGSPVVGVVTGIGASLALDEGYNYAERRFYESKQGAIAAVAGRTSTGNVAAWTHRGPLDITASRGRLEVIRRFGQIATCKEFVYTFEPLSPERLENAGTYDGGGPVVPVNLKHRPPAEAEVLVATACRQPDGAWRWAESRPSTGRWGGLQ